ncbi:MAG TPA: RNA polymerase sigma factor [Woeseiaceae bacterium]
MTASQTRACAARETLCTRRVLTYAAPMEDDGRPDDRALMLRYRDGDVAAFEVLYRRHNDALYRYLLRLCKDPGTAEDVFQDAWSNIIRARGNYRPTAQFNTYLYRVAHNCFIDNLRKNRRHAADEFNPEFHAHQGELPDVSAERSLARERLAVALEALPDEQRDAFLLREEAGLNVDEIAVVTGCNRETAKSRLRYAVGKLRAAIDEPAERS